jgi:CRP/FNR family transcriptional regulator, cyclic AMP receptor protein
VLLADASDAEWTTLLEHTRQHRFDPGEAIVTEGEHDRSLYLVLEGELEVLAPRGRRGAYRKVAVVGTGSVIGELAFFDGGARSAMVRAATPAVLAEMSPDSFSALAADSPALARQLLFDLGRILARRLRAAQATSNAAGN